MSTCGPRWVPVATSLATLLAACSSGDDPRSAAREDVTVFEGARVVVGDGSTVIDQAAFIVAGTRFAQIGRVGEIAPPPGARRVDLTGATVIPALVDLHSHLGYYDVAENSELKANYTHANLTDHLERYAYTGHALTVSLGSDPPDDWVWRMRGESEQPSFIGARFETVGRGLAWPGTGPAPDARNDTPYAVFTPWTGQVAVRELIDRGVPLVKLWVEDRNGFSVPGRSGPFVLGPEISQAVISEAHRLGRRVIAHVKTVSELKDLLRAGVDMWTHPIDDAPMDEALIELLRARSDLWYVPVFTPASSGGSAPRAPGERPEWLDDPLLRAIQCPAFLDQWGDQFAAGRGPSMPDRGGVGGQNARIFAETGVRIALGSHDAGWNRIHGWGSHMELEAFVRWLDMTPHQAIVAGTSAGAELLGRKDLGTIEAGKSADFVVLEANPLEDIRNTRRISRVFLRGSEVDRPTLARRWADQCSRAT